MAVVAEAAIAVVAVEVVAEAMQSATGADQTLSGVTSGVQTASSANDSSAAETKPDGDTPQEILHALPQARALEVSISRPGLRHLYGERSLNE